MEIMIFFLHHCIHINKFLLDHHAENYESNLKKERSALVFEIIAAIRDNWTGMWYFL